MTSVSETGRKSLSSQQYTVEQSHQPWQREHWQLCCQRNDARRMHRHQRRFIWQHMHHIILLY